MNPRADAPTAPDFYLRPPDGAHDTRQVALAPRIAAAAGIGAAFAALTWYLLAARDPSVQGADFTYAWLAARAILHGQNPYDLPATAFPFGGRFLYPMTSALVAVPFSALPAWLGGVVMVGLTAGLCAFAVTRTGEWWRLLMFTSAPALLVCYSVQWGAFFAFALLTPWAIGIVGAVKPQMALVLLAGQRSWRSLVAPVVVGGILLVVSLVIRPTWPFDLLHNMHDSTTGHFRSPLFTLWGIPLWLAALRWRDADARLLLCFAAVPQTNFFYDQLSLLMIARSRRELLPYILCTVFVLAVPLFVSFDRTNVLTLSRAYLPLVMLGGYYPALVLLFRHARIERPRVSASDFAIPIAPSKAD